MSCQTKLNCFRCSMAGLTIAPTQIDALNISWTAKCYESNIVFRWTPFNTNCTILYYSITSSKCGSCPTTSTDTNITCTDVPMDGSVCRLYVQAVICEGIISDPVPWQLLINSKCASKFQTMYPH